VKKGSIFKGDDIFGEKEAFEEPFIKESRITLSSGEISVLRALTLLSFNEDLSRGPEVWPSDVAKYGASHVGIPRGYSSSSFWTTKNVSRIMEQLSGKGLLEDQVPESRKGKWYLNVLAFERVGQDYDFTDGPEGSKAKSGRVYR